LACEAALGMLAGLVAGTFVMYLALRPHFAEQAHHSLDNGVVRVPDFGFNQVIKSVVGRLDSLEF
jgi:hypothetical protein